MQQQTRGKARQLNAGESKRKGETTRNKTHKGKQGGTQNATHKNKQVWTTTRKSNKQGTLKQGKKKKQGKSKNKW